MSPELSSPLPESVMAAEGDKEVAYPHLQPVPHQRPSDEPNNQDGRRVCGLKSKLFYGLLILLILVAIGLGVGLGVGLGTRNDGYAVAWLR